MQFLRSSLFNIFFPLWTLFIALFFYPAMLISSPRTVAIIGFIWAKISIISLNLLCGLKLEVRGLEHIPSMPFIVAAKHQSDLETIAFHIILEKPVYILKKELLKIPFFGSYLTNMGMISIDRNGGMSTLKSMLKDVQNRTEDERPVIIFPEGTRTEAGTSGHYHPGIAAIYSTGKYKILPVALNTGKFWAKGNFIKKSGTYVIEFLPHIEPGMDKKEFMSLLATRIEENSNKLLINE